MLISLAKTLQRYSFRKLLLTLRLFVLLCRVTTALTLIYYCCCAFTNPGYILGNQPYEGVVIKTV